MARPNACIYSSDDAKRLARRRLPRMIFDFIEGAAGREEGVRRNLTAISDILLQPRVMCDVAERVHSKRFLGFDFSLPFGIAPMGMCNLAHPGADKHMAELASELGIPVCLSSAGSSTLEDMFRWADGQTWFQLYFGQSAEATLAIAKRAEGAGYETLVLTVDVPQVSRRVRDLRNGFNLPFKMTPSAFLDFATHPRWSLSTLVAGIPAPRNLVAGPTSTGFDRRASRAGADWSFLKRLRDQWPGKLIVKGVTASDDAQQIKKLGADAIYVSNHGARQLDAAVPAIWALPLIREAVGPNYPLIYDSGIRNGEDIVKALAMGADFVMVGRPTLFALAAAGKSGLAELFDGFRQEIDSTMAQIGVRSPDEIDRRVLFQRDQNEDKRNQAQHTAALAIAR